MKRIVLLVATFFALACGCGALPELPGASDAEGAGDAEGASDAEGVGPRDAKAEKLGPKGKKAGMNLDGRWCEEDPEVGCYRFDGKTVYEEEVKLKRGKKLASQGTWSMEDNMLLMRFPSGTWTLEVLKHSENILVVKDWSQNDTFTFVRM